MITIEDVQSVFGGGRVAVQDMPLFCKHCDAGLTAKYERLDAARAPVKELVAVLNRRRVRVVKRVWPDGRRDWMCNGCGRHLADFADDGKI